MISTWFSPPEIAVRNARLILFFLVLIPLLFPGIDTARDLDEVAHLLMAGIGE